MADRNSIVGVITCNSGKHIPYVIRKYIGSEEHSLLFGKVGKRVAA
jgi:hypothetical protein